MVSSHLTVRGRVPGADAAAFEAAAQAAKDGCPISRALKGNVELTSFSYTRPIELAVNLAQIGSRSRTTVETYDPKNDALRFDLNIISPKPLRFSNNLVDMQLEVVEPGLAVQGTNQRFGAKGLLRIRPESKLRLRNTEFEVREGTVRFDDLTRINRDDDPAFEFARHVLDEFGVLQRGRAHNDTRHAEIEPALDALAQREHAVVGRRELERRQHLVLERLEQHAEAREPHERRQRGDVASGVLPAPGAREIVDPTHSDGLRSPSARCARLALALYDPR